MSGGTSGVENIFESQILDYQNKMQSSRVGLRQDWVVGKRTSEQTDTTDDKRSRMRAAATAKPRSPWHCSLTTLQQTPEAARWNTPRCYWHNLRRVEPPQRQGRWLGNDTESEAFLSTLSVFACGVRGFTSHQDLDFDKLWNCGRLRSHGTATEGHSQDSKNDGRLTAKLWSQTGLEPLDFAPAPFVGRLGPIT